MVCELSQPNKGADMNTQVMHEVMVATEEGRMTFPQVVEKLMGVGVESYLVDFATGYKTCYLASGESYREELTLTLNPVSEQFSAKAIVAAIRGAQADKVRYPEFVQLSTKAGVIGYWVFTTGQKVIYFGRKGEMHIEEFPNAKH
jgi:uncharacterized protein YbcV (DUF1398 family)